MMSQEHFHIALYMLHFGGSKPDTLELMSSGLYLDWQNRKAIGLTEEACPGTWDWNNENKHPANSVRINIVITPRTKRAEVCGKFELGYNWMPPEPAREI